MTASALDSMSAQRTLREYCAALYGAQCLVASDELGPRVSALLRYADTLLDALDVELLEAGLPPEAKELAVAQRLRERFQRLLLLVMTTSLRERGTRRAARVAATARVPRRAGRPTAAAATGSV